MIGQTTKTNTTPQFKPVNIENHAKAGTRNEKKKNLPRNLHAEYPKTVRNANPHLHQHAKSTSFIISSRFYQHTFLYCRSLAEKGRQKGTYTSR